MQTLAVTIYILLPAAKITCNLTKCKAPNIVSVWCLEHTIRSARQHCAVKLFLDTPGILAQCEPFSPPIFGKTNKLQKQRNGKTFDGKNGEKYKMLIKNYFSKVMKKLLEPWSQLLHTVSHFPIIFLRGRFN